MVRQFLLFAGIACALLGQIAPVSAQSDSRSTVEVIPLVLVGGAHPDHFFTSTLYLMNLSNTTTRVAVAAFADGEEADLLDSDSTPVPQTVIELLPGQAVRRILHPRVFDPARFPLRSAWLAVSGRAGDFSSAVRITQLGVGRVDSRTPILDLDRPQADVMVRSDFQIEGETPAEELRAFVSWDGAAGCIPTAISAYAFTNPNDRPARVRLLFVEPVGDNRRLHETRIEIPARTRITRLLSDLFAELFSPMPGDRPCHRPGERQSGVLEISSELPIAAAAVEVDLSNGHLVDLPVEAVREDGGF